MYKEIEKEVKIKEKHRFCDFCGTLAEDKYESNTCHLCKRDICHNCKKVSMFDNGGDYTEFICKECESTAKYYKKLIEELETRIDNLYEIMEATCRKNNKEK